MRRVVYSVASSLDGFIAGPEGEFDWIPADPDVDFAALFARFDAVLMGRRSYEAARAQGEGGMPALPTWVFSTTLRPARASLLRSEVIPPVGGDTMFTNMYLAYETLSETMKRVIEPLEAIHDMTVARQLRGRDPADLADVDILLDNKI